MPSTNWEGKVAAATVTLALNVLPAPPSVDMTLTRLFFTPGTCRLRSR